MKVWVIKLHYLVYEATAGINLHLSFSGHDSSNPVLCRRCGRPIADPAYIRPNLEVSPFDELQKNVSTLFGQKGDFPVQSLVNPHGDKFDLVLFQKAGCQGVHGVGLFFLSEHHALPLI